MHNTFVVNGRGASEPRGPFHWRTSTDAACTAWETGTERDYAEGSHHGYGAITHTRRVLALHGIGWVIVDHLGGSGLADAAAMWHIDPSWRVSPRSASSAELVHADGERLGLASNAELRLIHEN